VGTGERRDGELKTCWTKPLHKSSVYGFSMVRRISGQASEGRVLGCCWMRVKGNRPWFSLRIDKIIVGTPE
jgi:hypothetical protein